MAGATKMEMAQQLRIGGNLKTRAAFEPATFDEKRGTVDVVWTTGARGKRNSWSQGPYYEELEVSEKAVDLSRMNNGASVLDAHDQYSGVRAVLGVVERAWISGKEGRATVRFSDREDVKPIKADVQNGILRHVSVGYSVQKYEKVEETDGVPVYRATRWMPAEISLVPVAFDDGAVVRERTESEFYEVDLSTAEEKRTMAIETTAATDAAPAKPAAPIPAAVAAAEDATRAAETRAADLATRTERERASGIRALVRRAKLTDEFADELVTKGAALDAARTAILDKLAAADEAVKTEQHVRVEVGEDATDKFRTGAEAWLLTKAMVTDTVRAAQKNPAVSEIFKDVAFDPGEFRGMTMLDLARESLERRGMKTRGLDKRRVVEMAMATRDSGGMNSTSDFAVVLENTLHKTLLASYVTTPDTWSRFCTVRSASDFRAQNLYRNGSFGVLDSLNEHGELKNKAIPDGEKRSFLIGTKGNIIALSRQAIVNDDMGAFTDLASRFGRAARLSIEVDVYALLGQNSGLGPAFADTKPLFDAAHSNISTAGALGVAQLDSDRILMASQKDPSGNEILDLRPAVLVVPIGLGGQARVINVAVYDTDAVGGAGTSNKFQMPNRVAGLFREIVDSPRITGTRRYVFADPNIAPVLAVAFLDGQQLPYLESDLGWRVDGIEWKLRLDYGVAAIDWRGAVTNAGA